MAIMDSFQAKKKNWEDHLPSKVWKSSSSTSSGRLTIAIAIAIAGAFSCIYALLAIFTADPCSFALNCRKPMCYNSPPASLPLTKGVGIEKGNFRLAQAYSSTPTLIPLATEGARLGTNLSHIVFGIAASASLWPKRKEYIKLWWRPGVMRGQVWLDSWPKDSRKEEKGLPPLRISADTSRFEYTNPRGHRSAIRISRIVSETMRLLRRAPAGDVGEVRWLVMGDDDTVFVPENLLQVLSKYDHRQFYYIGSNSESHLQNIMLFSYNMAYGGGGFAISYPLALALEKMQDDCISRYPYLFGSDDRIQACMAEIGVPLTREPGFHQYDVYGNLFGLMASHPLVPLVSLHHLDVVDPVFPNRTRINALRHLLSAVDLDPAGFLQQTICYDEEREWSVSVAWGYAVQVFRGIVPARELELPSRTFYNWHKKADYTAYAFNTRPFARSPCQRPYRFYMAQAGRTTHALPHMQRLINKYTREDAEPIECRWNITSPTSIDTVTVVTHLDNTIWDRAPRRKCCRVMLTDLDKKKMAIDIGECKAGEIMAVPNKKQRPLLVRM